VLNAVAAEAIATRRETEESMNQRVYLHEVIDITGARRKDYFEHMTTGFRDAIGQRVGMSTFGIWGTLGSTGRWPEVINLWEYDGWNALAGTFAHETRGRAGMQDPALAAWWEKAQAMRSGGYDRLLIPTTFSPALAALPSLGITGSEVFRHEIICVRAGEARTYLNRVHDEWLPYLATLGVKLTGAYRTALRDDSEVVLIWAIESWEAWAEAEQAIDNGGLALRWREAIRPLVTHFKAELMCSAPLSPTHTGRQP
jgi:hypothetical protein